MKFSCNWLRELVEGLDLPPRELTRLITLKTAECEGVEEFAPWLAGVVAARVESVEPIAGSANVAAQVDAGPKLGRRQVVCGAPNCRPGVLSAYVPAGVRLAGLEIGRAVLSGVESDGMLAAGDELGLNRDHEGILELPEGTAPGAPLPGAAPDWVIEVDNKSLTHRPDLWGHHGMAREIAAFTGSQLKEPANLALLPSGSPAWKVEIEDLDLAPRYSALVFENVTVGPSPLWLQARLEAIGLNPISNIVDVTNCIMAELAQPMHAFDADKLQGGAIFVRRARGGETCTALNGETYTLQPSNLVIADAGGPVAIAGVIGGMASAVTAWTRRLVFESANFHPASIRKTSSALKLRTDASMRFEKAQDPVNTVRALARAVELLPLVSPGIRVAGGLVDGGGAFAAPPPIELRHDWVERKLGRTVEPAEARRILEALAFTVSEPRPRVFNVGVPSWRATKDVTIKDDLVEEIGRLVGYDSIAPQPPLTPAVQPWINQVRRFHHQIRAICAAQGFTETYNYSFLSEDEARRFHWNPEEHVRVLNPISSEQGLLRLSLLAGLHRNIEENAKRFESFRLFEIGYEIHKQPAGLPQERARLMAAIYSTDDGRAALADLKRLAECLMPGATVQGAEAGPNEHPARSHTVHYQDRLFGRLYELHPSLLDGGRAAILEVDLDLLFTTGWPDARYRPPQRYPSSSFDLSVVTDLRTVYASLEQAVHEAAAVDAVEYLYTYRGQPLPEDRQSVTLRITVSAGDRTLTNEEVTARRDAIMARFRAAGHDLRGTA